MNPFRVNQVNNFTVTGIGASAPIVPRLGNVVGADATGVGTTYEMGRPVLRWCSSLFRIAALFAALGLSIGSAENVKKPRQETVERRAAESPDPMSGEGKEEEDDDVSFAPTKPGSNSESDGEGDGEESDESPRPRPATSSSFRRAVIAAHNRYREELDLKPLVWSESLAADASVWARRLASRGEFHHSSGRGNVGENLWKGTAGAFTLKQMVDGWGGEKKDFRYGTFPDVSTTGDWRVVGHYTQMIWRPTRKVGCAIARGNGEDVLVCRYSPSGNVMGRKPY